jgi:hypothetical protein
LTARSTFESTVAASNPVLVASNQSAANAAQETINSVGVNAGNPTGRGVSAAADLTIRQANAAYIAAKAASAMAQQATIQVARDTLAATGDVGSR